MTDYFQPVNHQFISDYSGNTRGYWSPALVVPLVGSWNRQTLVHVTMEKSEHVPSGEKT